jgi:hypothetical protein
MMMDWMLSVSWLEASWDVTAITISLSTGFVAAISELPHDCREECTTVVLVRTVISSRNLEQPRTSRIFIGLKCIYVRALYDDHVP